MSVASGCCIYCVHLINIITTARHLDAGNPLELSIPRQIWKQFAGQEKNLGMGTSRKIGQSAGQYLRVIIYGTASEIAKVSGYKRTLEVRSIPYRKL
jgi:hypothetical protein